MNKQSTVMTNATASNREVWREGLRNELRSENREPRIENGKRKTQVAQSEIKKMYAQQKGENAAVAQGTKECTEGQTER